MLGVLAATLRRKEKPPLSLLYVGIPSAAFGLGLVVAATTYGGRLYEWVYRAVGLHTTQVLVAVFVVGTGIFAHLFKKKNQMFYGICEVFFAAASAFQISLTMKPGETVLSQWAALVGASYVVARGLNNISEYRQKRNQPAGVDASK